jgi:hypothetical protein
MPCGGSKPRLPVNGTVVQITAKRERKEPAKPKLIDYHCDVCGYSGASKKHTCKPKPIAWQETRARICKRCPYDVDDVCTLYKSQHPDRDALVSIGVTIPYAKCPAGLWNRVELTCEKCQSVTYSESGVDRCKVCRWQPHNKISLPTIVRLKDEEPYTPTQPLAVVTLAVGQKTIDVHAITGTQMQRYAERCDADYHAILDDQCPRYPLANKFRLANLTQHYDRVLFLDADVWIKPDVPNIFETLPAGSVWMHPDRTMQSDPDYLISTYASVAQQQQVEPIADFACYNTGVVLFDREHRDMWTAMPLPSPTSHLTEQIWVEYMLRRLAIPVQSMPTVWNTQYWFSRFIDHEPAAYFVHLAACPHEERIYRLRKLAFASQK